MATRQSEPRGVPKGRRSSADSTSRPLPARKTGQPFTLAHFKAWAKTLTLDNNSPWRLEPFQSAFVADVFAGAREAWLVVPEGNGKTTLVAGLALYHAAHMQWASVSVAASSREQAEIVFRAAEGLIVRSEREATFRAQEGYRRIRCDSMSSRIQIMAADAGTGDGIQPTLTIVDELHRHRDLRLYRLWAGKLEKRAGQMIAISTAGEPGSDFENTREAIRRSAKDLHREGAFRRAVAGQVVMHEWAVPDDGDVEDFEQVKAANPLRAITVASLATKRARPTMMLDHWRRFVCNLPTRGNQAAITEGEWEAARVEDDIPVGDRIWVGLDVAWKWDTTAIVPVWARDEDYYLLGPATVLVPPRDGSSLDPHRVEDALVEIHDRNPVETVVMDPSKAEQLAAWIREELGAEVIERQQTNKFGAMDYERFMEGLREGWLHHAGDPDLTRHVLNAVARTLPFGDHRFDRPEQSRRSPTQQDIRVIDALTAAAMVLTTARAEDETEEPFVAWV